MKYLQSGVLLLYALLILLNYLLNLSYDFALAVGGIVVGVILIVLSVLDYLD